MQPVGVRLGCRPQRAGDGQAAGRVASGEDHGGGEHVGRPGWPGHLSRFLVPQAATGAEHVTEPLGRLDFLLAHNATMVAGRKGIR